MKNLRPLSARLAAALIATAMLSCAAQDDVIVSPIAGSWYPGDAAALRTMLNGFLAAAGEPAGGAPCAMIVPHAGYRFSGAVAGHAYAQLQGRAVDRVVVMGPTHRVPMADLASVPSASWYETPLGRLEIDRDAVARLLKHPRFRSIPQAHAGEHSVEIQLPFIQVVAPAAKIVPIVVGQLSPEGVRDIAAALAAVLDGRTVVLASSDFTHYGPNYDYVPFREDVEENLRRLDMGAYERIAARDIEGFMRYCGETGATICGRDDIAVLLAMLPKGATARLLKYDTSGRMMGDFGNSVSYLAVAFDGAWAGREKQEATPMTDANDALPAADRAALLKLARGTLERYFDTGRMPSPEELGVTVTPPMERVMGAFVTLTEEKELRGCIGEIYPRRELYKAVMEHAIDSAIHDRRFLPVSRGELSKLAFEISALEPPRPVDSYRDIVIGKHGVVLRKGGASAVFLPQVAPEQGWGLEETLAHLSMKAGLPADAWKEGAKFEVFEAIVFGEEER